MLIDISGFVWTISELMASCISPVTHIIMQKDILFCVHYLLHRQIPHFEFIKICQYLQHPLEFLL